MTIIPIAEWPVLFNLFKIDPYRLVNGQENLKEINKVYYAIADHVMLVRTAREINVT